MKNAKYYEILGRLQSYEIGATEEMAETILKIRRLAKKHHRLAEMDCNGFGVIRGICYYNGHIDDYARRTYGQGVKTAYIGKFENTEETVFMVESDKIEDKITELCKQAGLTPEFQGDPRGYTVRLYDAITGKDVTGILN